MIIQSSRAWVDIVGCIEVRMGVLEEHVAAVSVAVGLQAADQLLADCPTYSTSVEGFSMSKYPVSMADFREFWESDYRRDALQASESDESFWDQVFDIPGLRMDRAVLGMTHAEARSCAGYFGCRVAYQHEIEYALNCCFLEPILRIGAGDNQPSTLQFWDTYDWVHGLAEAAIPVTRSGLVGLYDFAYVLTFIDPSFQKVESDYGSDDVIKPLGPSERFLHSGSYLRFPVWRFYLGEQRMFPLHPAAVWLVKG